MKRCDVTVCNIIKNMNKIRINCKMLKCLFFVQSNLKSTVDFNEEKKSNQPKRSDRPNEKLINAIVK